MVFCFAISNLREREEGIRSVRRIRFVGLVMVIGCLMYRNVSAGLQSWITDRYHRSLKLIGACNFQD